MEKRCKSTIWNPVIPVGKKAGKRWLSGMLALILTVSGGVLGTPQAVQGAQMSQEVSSFKTGEIWNDTEGEPIQAHGGQIQKFGDTYYWYGEDKTRGGRPIDGVRAYSSKDLYNWKDEGSVLKVMENREQFETDSYFQNLYADCTEEEKDEVYLNLRASNCIVERPKVLYNEKTGKYVMWFHSDGPAAGKEEDSTASRYSRAMAGVAVSDSPNGPFRYVDSFKLHWVDGYASTERRGDSRDMNVFQDEDGSAYIIYSSEMNAYLYIAKLSEDYLGLATPAGEVTPQAGKSGDGETWQARILPDTSREAPAVFKSGEYYYMITSGTSGWDPNQAKYYRSKDLMAEKWESMGDPCEGGSKTTFGSQSTYVFPIDPENGFYLYMGDRWKNGDLKNSTYVWLPLIVNGDGTITIKNYDEWSIEETPGTIIREIEGLEAYDTTDLGRLPELPEEVTITWLNGKQETAAVDWETLTAADFSEPFLKKTVTGTVKGQTVQTEIEVVPESLAYFIDCGTGSWGPESTDYPKVAALNQGLLNQVSDQEYKDGAQWGYVKTTANKALVLTPDGATGKAASKYVVGVRTALDYITYKMKLNAGTYQFTAGFHEWWSGQKRTMKPVVTYTDADGTEKTLEGSTFTTSGSDMTVTEEFTIPVDGEVSYTLKKVANSAPVLSFLAVTEITEDNRLPGKVTASPAAGRYELDEMKQVELSSETEDQIYYTLDGTDPMLRDGSAEVADGALLYESPIVFPEEGIYELTARSMKTRSDGTVVWGAVMTARYNITESSGPVEQYDSVPVGKSWYDEDGNLIQAHGGGFLQMEDENGPIYYWVGEDKSHNAASFNGINLYSSRDLLNWKFENTILKPDAENPGLKDNKIERPKLIYNQKTGQFIIWGHWETADSYASSQICVAVCDQVDGDYTFLGHWRPGGTEKNWRTKTVNGKTIYVKDDGYESASVNQVTPDGNQSRDMTLYVDGDKGYLVSACADQHSICIYTLNDDFTDVVPGSEYHVFASAKLEAPAIIKADGYYFLLGSGQSGWYPNQARYAYTEDISDGDSWSELEMIGNNTSFYSQPTNIMELTSPTGEKNYVYMGDRWNSKKLGSSTYVWLPLEIDGTDMRFSYVPEWSLDAEAGTIRYEAVEVVSTDKPVTCTVEGKEGYGVEKANDGYYFNANKTGTSSSYFRPESLPFTWTVDLEDVYDLARIDLSFNHWNGSEAYHQYYIYGSVDGNKWKLLADESDNKTTGFKSHDLKGQYRYVKLEVTKAIKDKDNQSASFAAGLVEVEVFARTKAEAAKVTGIKVTKAPIRTSYEIGETFDPQGLEVTAYYEDGSEVVLESGQYELGEVDTSTTGKQEVAVIYTSEEGREFKTSFEIIVYDGASMYMDKLKVVKQPDKTVYYAGEEFDPTGMEVRALMKASASDAVPEKVKILSEDDYALEYDFGTPGKEKVTVVYYGIDKDGEARELTDTVPVTVIDGDVSYYETGIRVKKQPDKKVYRTGDSFDGTGMTVTRTMKATPSNASPSNASYTEEITDYYLEGDDFTTIGKKTVSILHDGTDANGDDKTFKTSLIVTVTNRISDILEAELEAIGNHLKEFLIGENAEYLLEEEKQAAAAEAQEKLYRVLENEEDWTLTDQILNQIASIEKDYLTVYPNIGLKVLNKTQFAEDVKISGAGLAAEGKLDSQRVEITLSDTDVPEGLEELAGKRAYAMNLSLTVNGEPTELKVPVSVSMKITDKDMDGTLNILLIKDSGEQEEIVPEIKNGVMTFGLKSFGTLVVYADQADGEDGDGHETERILERIAVTSLPVKMVYQIGEAFRSEGLVITAYYSDGSEEVVENWRISGFDSDAAGTKTLTVSYQGQQTTFEVTVQKKRDNHTIGGSSSGSRSGAGASVLANIPGTWRLDEKGWWYEKTSGGYLKAEWGRINGAWYYFNEEGYMATGWIQVGGRWYFLNADGAMAETNWVLSGADWYYLNSDGAMATNQWVSWKAKWYYLGQDGKMAVDQLTPDGYRVDANGVWTE